MLTKNFMNIKLSVGEADAARKLANTVVGSSCHVSNQEHVNSARRDGADRSGSALKAHWNVALGVNVDRDDLVASRIRLRCHVVEAANGHDFLSKDAEAVSIVEIHEG